MEFIKDHPGTTYAEIETVFDRIGFEWKGDLVQCDGANDSIVFWEDWNSEAIKVVNGLLQSGAIRKEPTHPIIYIVDGKTLPLPAAKVRRKYKKPHWLPITFSAV